MGESTLRPLIARDRIAAKVTEIALRIGEDFAGEPVILIGVLKGAAIFLADLARHVPLDASFDFIAVSGYGGQRQHSGEVKLVKDVDDSLEDKNVVLVEDILDTGLTLTYLKNLLLARSPKALKIAVLLDKPDRRIQPRGGQTTLGSRSPMNSWSDMAWISPSDIVIFGHLHFGIIVGWRVESPFSSCLSMPQSFPEFQPS